MKIGKGHLLRDFSGTYACPKCWPHPTIGLVPGTNPCPHCQEPLEWDDHSFEAYKYYKEMREKRGLS